MKKIFLLIVLIVLMAFANVYASGTISVYDSDNARTITLTGLNINHYNPWKVLGSGVWYIDIIYTDDTNGINAAFPVPTALYGKQVFKALVDPGATAPTAGYDIEIRWNSIDIFSGGIYDLSASDNEAFDFTIYAPIDGDLYFYLTGNDVNNATGTVRLYVK